ncbi:MAG: hypothetical protein ACXWR1_04635 [Bdellovibrionota bacterium]
MKIISILFTFLTLSQIQARAEAPAVNANSLDDVPNQEQQRDYGWQFDPSADTGTVGYHAENRHELYALQASKDCGKSAALEAAKTSMKRIAVFRALLERDKKNLADVQRVLDKRGLPAGIWGAQGEAKAIPLMTTTLDDLEYRSTDGRFANLKEACTNGTGTALHNVAYWDKQYDKSILTGDADDRIYDSLPRDLINAAGKVIPSKSFDTPAGHLGFLRGIRVSSILPNANGCYFLVPFDRLAVEKVTQERTYDGNKLSFACDAKFKGVQLVPQGDTVQVQIHEEHHWLVNGVDYPDSRKIMNKVLEATDGPGASYQWEDYGSTDGLDADSFR